MRGYYFITDHALSLGGFERDAEQAVRAGVCCIQYRSKCADIRTLLAEARRLKEICSATSTRLIINDRVDIAMAVDADGVHLGQDDMPFEDARRCLGRKKLIGLSVRTVDEAVAAACRGADYLGIGPIFTTSTKSDAGEPCGLAVLRQIRQHCTIPLVAIGGIGLPTVRAVIDAGADMVCAISAVVTQLDVAGSIRRFQKEFEP